MKRQVRIFTAMRSKLETVEEVAIVIVGVVVDPTFRCPSGHDHISHIFYPTIRERFNCNENIMHDC